MSHTEILENVSFRDQVIDTRLSFQNRQFTGFTDFRGAKFQEIVDFSGAQFLGTADFSGCSSRDPLKFDRARFEGKADFSKADFGHNVQFTKTFFANTVDFSGTTFRAWGLFEDSTFQSEAAFSEAVFIGSARFARAAFDRNADFHRARFITYADFPKAMFRGRAGFTEAILECKTVLAGAIFERDADFTDCRFTHALNLKGAHFAAQACFDRVVLLQFVDFSGARIADAFLLSPPKNLEGLAPEIRFESVVLDSPAKVRFKDISFERITLMGTKLRGIGFVNPKWPKRGVFFPRTVVYDEIQKEKPDPQELANLYRDVRANLKAAGTTTDLGDLFYSEMEVRRKQRRAGNDGFYFLRRYFSPYTLLWLTCGYGRRRLRALISAGIGAAVYFWI